MARITLTEAEALDALIGVLPTAPKEAQTVWEIVERTGRSAFCVRAMLRELQKQGRLQMFKVQRGAIDGRVSKIPAYIVLRSKKGTRR